MKTKAEPLLFLLWTALKVLVVLGAIRAGLFACGFTGRVPVIDDIWEALVRSAEYWNISGGWRLPGI